MTSENLEMTHDDKPSLITVRTRKNLKKINIPVIVILVVALIALIALIVFIIIEANSGLDDEELGECKTVHDSYNLTSDAKLVNFTKYAVSVDHRECSAAGKSIIEKGGSAVDAAIAAGLCNSVMNPQSMGIGGGHFMYADTNQCTISRSTNKSYIIDARDIAPMNAYKEMFVNREDKSLYGGLSTGIPGELYGYYKAHQLAGRLPWRELFKPAIKLSEEGFTVSRALEQALVTEQDRLRQSPSLAEIFINPKTDSVYRQGDVIKRVKYAQTLKEVSENGYEAFYRGTLTPIMVDEINKNGGNVTVEDFRRYEPRVHQDRFVIRLDDNLRLYTVPPPSSGLLVPVIIRIMKKFGFEDYNKMTSKSWDKFYHRLIESFKHVYAKRHFFGDEQFVNMTHILKEINDQKFIDEIVEKIDEKRTFPEAYYGVGNPKHEYGTSHISILAPNGDAVSLTSSINYYFGGLYAGDRTGIIYSDTMDDFSTPQLNNMFGFTASEANFIAPGKRPLSAMSPLIVVDNKNQVKLVLGAGGGSKIISAVSQVAIKILYMGMDIKTAIDDRRIHHQLSPGYAQFEEGFSHWITDGLKKIGHELKCFTFGGSTIQAVQATDENLIFAYADPRKGGVPDGV